MTDSPLELVFYIHGVTPGRKAGPHQNEYQALHNGIAAAPELNNQWPTTRAEGAEWGWNSDDGQRITHKALADAQEVLGAQLLERVRQPHDVGLVPSFAVNRLRELIFYGFGDMFYYVSQEGKWAVRSAVAEQLKRYLEKRQVNNQPISLTLVGHSAGSVIALDFLYYIFKPDPTAPSPDSPLPEVPSYRKQLADLRQMARDSKLRLRRLITFGSPISFMMLRNNTLVESFAQGGKLTGEDFGMRSELKGCRLTGPRWINLWDRHDLIAWPAEPLMDASYVEDVYVDVGDEPNSAHTAYWRSKAVHRAIAERW